MSNKRRLPTAFAPAERASADALADTLTAVVRSPITTALLEAEGSVLLVLNRERQIVAANSEILKLPVVESVEAVLGQRPGEALRCVHADDSEGGCGTSEFCRTCGAAVSILAAQTTGMRHDAECLLTMRRNGELESREYAARASQVSIGGHDLTVLSLRDTSDEKRRQALEQVFLHDIINTAGGLSAWAQILEQGVAEDQAAKRIVVLARMLVDEIQFHRDLLEAEAGDLAVKLEEVAPGDVLRVVTNVFAGHAVARGRALLVDPPPASVSIVTSRTLLARVLTNLVKNGLEAVPEGETVRMGCDATAERVVFHVTNPGEIPAAVVQRIFQRSFSTKAQRGRGLGAYSAKLFGERHLGGVVSFTTGPEGTRFQIDLPRGGPASLR